MTRGRGRSPNMPVFCTLRARALMELAMSAGAVSLSDCGEGGVSQVQLYSGGLTGVAMCCEGLNMGTSSGADEATTGWTEDRSR